VCAHESDKRRLDDDADADADADADDGDDDIAAEDVLLADPAAAAAAADDARWLPLSLPFTPLPQLPPPPPPPSLNRTTTHESFTLTCKSTVTLNCMYSLHELTLHVLQISQWSNL
jgi:hypothetical protein